MTITTIIMYEYTTSTIRVLCASILRIHVEYYEYVTDTTSTLLVHYQYNTSVIHEYSSTIRVLDKFYTRTLLRYDTSTTRTMYEQTTSTFRVLRTSTLRVLLQELRVRYKYDEDYVNMIRVLYEYWMSSIRVRYMSKL